MAFLNQNHLDNITFTVLLDPAPTQQAGFSTPLLLADEANGNGLGGDRFRLYSNISEIETDEDAGDISSFIADGLRAGLAQTPAPQQLMAGRVDTGGGETYTDALGEVETAGGDFYGVAIESRADADILDIAAGVATRRQICAVQADNTDLYSGALSASTLSALETTGDGERTLLCFHDDDTQWFDFAYLANRLAFNPDVQSVPWDTGISDVEPYTAVGGTGVTVLSTTEKNQLDTNNVNHGLELGSSSFFVDPGVAVSGRPVYERLTVDWFLTRLEERLANLKVLLSSRGQKLTIDRNGQAKVLSVVNGLLDIATQDPSPHFLPGQTEIVPIAVTDADRDAQRMRFSGRFTFAVSARKLDFILNFTRQPIFTAAA